MSDLNDLLKAIILHPDEDVPRLAYADALDELAPVYKACPKCGGLGGKTDGYGANAWVPCGCESGRVLDTANRDRAELIRIGCELHNKPCHAFMYSCHENGCPQCECSDGGKYDQLRARERELWNAAVAGKSAFKWLGNSLDIFLSNTNTAPRVFVGATPGAGTGVPVLRGFLSSLTCTAEVFLRNADALIWHPEQTVKCDICKGEWCEEGITTRTYYCSTCAHTKTPGRIPRTECPPTAQPIREVTLTTWPSIAYLNEWEMATFGRYDHLAFYSSAERMFHTRWPGVKFHLPPA